MISLALDDFLLATLRRQHFFHDENYGEDDICFESVSQGFGYNLSGVGLAAQLSTNSLSRLIVRGRGEYTEWWCC
jgi:hypothetical protein